MGNQVYRIGYLRDMVLAFLRTKSEPVTAGAITVALDLPGWAVEAGLDAALAGQLVHFGSNGFWTDSGVLERYKQNEGPARTNIGNEATKLIAKG